jgi:hypothetical protein
MEDTSNYIPSLQVISIRSAFTLLSDDDKYDAIETLMSDLGILAWHDNKHDGPLLRSLIRMESSRIISKPDFDRMNQLIQVFVRQSLGSSYDSGVSGGKLIIYSPTSSHMNNNDGLINIQNDINHCLQHYTPLNIRIFGSVDGKPIQIWMSHLVHHYSENVEKLTAFGYDLSGVLLNDD